MSAASNYLENKILDHVLTATSYSQPSRFLALTQPAQAKQVATPMKFLLLAQPMLAKQSHSQPHQAVVLLPTPL